MRVADWPSLCVHLQYLSINPIDAFIMEALEPIIFSQLFHNYFDELLQWHLRKQPPFI